MLYRVTKRTIENGLRDGTLDVEDMQNKLDIFFVTSRITQEQYTELSGMISAAE